MKQLTFLFALVLMFSASFALNTTALNLSISPSSNVTYGTTVTVTGSDCPPELTCLLKLDGTAVSNPFSFVAVNNKVFTYSTPGNENWSSDSVSETLNVSYTDIVTSTVTITTPQKGSNTLDTLIISVVEVNVTDSPGLASCTSYFNSVSIKTYSIIGNGTVSFQESLSPVNGENTYRISCVSGGLFSDASTFAFKSEPSWILIGTIFAMIVIIVWLFG